MFIKQITIEATDGIDVVFKHRELEDQIGCEVWKDGRRVTALDRRDEDSTAMIAARHAAGAICGWTEIAGLPAPDASIEMILDVLREMRRVAGC